VALVWHQVQYEQLSFWRNRPQHPGVDWSALGILLAWGAVGTLMALRRFRWLPGQD
jgi:hypothetical protein